MRQQTCGLGARQTVGLTGSYDVRTLSEKYLVRETEKQSAAARRYKFDHLHLEFGAWRASGTTKISVREELSADCSHS